MSDVKVSFGAEWGELKNSVDEMKEYIAGLAGTANAALGAGAAGGIGTVLVMGFNKLRAEMTGLMQTGGEVIEIQTNLESAMKATGEAAGFTAAQMRDLADHIQETTKFEDEAAKKAMTMMSAFTNVRGDEFKRTLDLAADLAQMMGGDLVTSANMLGAALENPTRGMMMLRRQKIFLKKEEEENITAMMEANNILGAQQALLDVVAGKYGGAAKAAADAKGGGLTQLWNILNDIYESVGVGLVNVFSEFLPVMKGVASSAKDLAENFEGMGASIGDSIKSAFETGSAWMTFFFEFGESALVGFQTIWEGFFGGTAVDSISGTWEVVKSFFIGFLRLAVGVMTAYQVAWENIPTVVRFAVFTMMAETTTFFNTLSYYFTEVIPKTILWFSENWQEIFMDIYNYTTTVITNMATNIINFFESVWGWLNGEEGDFKWTSLTEGFEATLKELPDIAEREMGALEKTLWDKANKQGSILSGASRLRSAQRQLQKKLRQNLTWWEPQRLSLSMHNGNISNSSRRTRRAY
jgi:hypothetical protein